MPRLRLAVFGYDELLLAHLDVLAETDANVVAVVFPHNRTSAPAREIRAEVKRRGFKTFEQPGRDASEALVSTLRALELDLILCWSYPLILPPEVLAIPPDGCLNLHFGILPKYRGGSAFRWAVANGEAETGVTLHEMTQEADAGPILGIARVAIRDDDKIADVMRNLCSAGQSLLRNMWTSIADGTAPRLSQDTALADAYPVWSEEDGRIDWTASNRAIHNLVRSLTYPFSGAFTTYRKHRLIVTKVKCVEIGPADAHPGTIVARSDLGPVVVCGEGGIVLCRVAPARGHQDAQLSISLGGRFGT